MEPLKLSVQPGLAFLRPRSSSTRFSPSPGSVPVSSPLIGHLDKTREKTSFWMFIKQVCHYGGMAAFPPCWAPSALCSGPWSEDQQNWNKMRSSPERRCLLPFSLGDRQRVAVTIIQVRSGSSSGERSSRTWSAIAAPMSARAELVPKREMAQLGQG